MVVNQPTHWVTDCKRAPYLASRFKLNVLSSMSLRLTALQRASREQQDGIRDQETSSRSASLATPCGSFATARIALVTKS